MLKATFVRRRGHRDRVYVTRADGTSTGWDFPSYGDGLPHDMCHLVVEDELKLTDGFWGLIDQGAEIEPVNGHSTLVHNGKPLVDLSGSDFAGLIQAEAVVAALAGPGSGYGSAGDSALSWRLLPPWTSLGEVAAGGGSRTQLPVSAAPRSVAAISDRLRQLTKQWRDLSDGAGMTLEFDRSGFSAAR